MGQIGEENCHPTFWRLTFGTPKFAAPAHSLSLWKVKLFSFFEELAEPVRKPPGLKSERDAHRLVWVVGSRSVSNFAIWDVLLPLSSVGCLASCAKPLSTNTRHHVWPALCCFSQPVFWKGSETQPKKDKVTKFSLYFCPFVSNHQGWCKQLGDQEGS